MANEISINVSVTYTNPASNVSADTLSATPSVSISVAPGAYERNVQQVTTAKVALNLALIANVGYILMHNCDQVNSLNVWQNTGITPAALTLLPGEWQLVRFTAGSVPQVQNAGSGTILFEYFAIDN